ncbi:hypothetical protein RJT34_13966 [Clitoria ternatea]|uniref:Remorin C-terminal domain-containing protein n=1 Tax=Clitoria ternatea TaxID=43366 RepID=A0AAN9JSH0_CLITE
MEYERIGKVKAETISPSKLRMKLIGHHHHRKKDGSNSNSTRTSPSRLEDAEFVKNSLLASESHNLEVTYQSSEVLSIKPTSNGVPVDRTSCQPKETMPRENHGMRKMQHYKKVDSANSSSIHLVKTEDEENHGYDSNTSSSSFEFHRGEKPVFNPATRFLLRPIPSKWNDAEKWIMNKQNLHSSYQKRNVLHSQANRVSTRSMMRVAPESSYFDHKLTISNVTETARVDFCQPTSHAGFEKSSFIPPVAHSFSGLSRGRIPVVESFHQSKDLKEVNELDSSCSRSTDDQTAIPGMRSVAMRDLGTEMTPITSQVPSRTSTPAGSATPLRTPTSSMPSTPMRDAPNATPLDIISVEDSQFPVENTKKQSSKEEMKLKKRREIQALGIQLGLGKRNTVATTWAGKSEQRKKKSYSKDFKYAEEHEKIEFEKRATLWEQAEKSRHIARYKHEKIKIQAWESQQKAKLEAELRRIEAKVEQVKAQAQAKTVKKIAMVRQRSAEKHADAEARRNQEARRTTAKAEYIRHTGRVPSSNYICCGWL